MSRYFRPEGVLYESVDGLLLLLCLWQVLVIPIFTAIEFATYLPHAFHAADLMTSISVFIGLGFDAMFALFSILAGVLLWLKRRAGAYLSLAFQGLRIVSVVAVIVLNCIGEVAANHVPLGTAILHFFNSARDRGRYLVGLDRLSTDVPSRQIYVLRAARRGGLGVGLAISAGTMRFPAP